MASDGLNGSLACGGPQCALDPFADSNCVHSPNHAPGKDVPQHS
jgi:hypothetical protein